MVVNRTQREGHLHGPPSLPDNAVKAAVFWFNVVKLLAISAPLLAAILCFYRWKGIPGDESISNTVEAPTAIMALFCRFRLRL